MRMGLSGWNAVVFVALTGVWIASGTQREKPVLAAVPSADLPRLEADVAARPPDPLALRGRAQAPARSLTGHGPSAVRQEPRVDHTYARALLDQGRAEEALATERRVLDA